MSTGDTGALVPALRALEQAAKLVTKAREFQCLRRDRDSGETEYQIYADTEKPRDGMQIAYVQSTKHDAEFIALALECAPQLAALLHAAETPPARIDDVGDHVCEHGTALDVHCCNCHSGFIFDVKHECPDSPPSPEPAAETLIAEIVQQVAELPDRTSPEDWPEAMLVTADELTAILAPLVARWREERKEAETQRHALSDATASIKLANYLREQAEATCARLEARLKVVEDERDDARLQIGTAASSIRTKRAEIERLEADLAAAREALAMAAPHVCSFRCPSVKKTGDPWSHTLECEAITKALAAAPSAPQGEEKKP